MFDPHKIPGSRSLPERKQVTWALLIGETYSSAVHAETRRRPHRGMLPDVDFSRAAPDFSRPSLARGPIRMMIRPGDGQGSAAGAATRSGDAVGETLALAYSNNENPPSIPDDSSGMRGFARAA
jgi:hypothetical protein